MNREGPTISSALPTPLPPEQSSNEVRQQDRSRTQGPGRSQCSSYLRLLTLVLQRCCDRLLGEGLHDRIPGRVRVQAIVAEFFLQHPAFINHRREVIKITAAIL